MNRVVSILLLSLLLLSMMPTIVPVIVTASPLLTIKAVTQVINGTNWKQWVIRGTGTEADPYVLNVSGTTWNNIIKFTNFINTTGIWFLIENATLETNDWATIDIESNVSGVNIIVKNTTIKNADTGIFLKNAKDVTVVLDNVTAIDVSNGASWAGLFDTDQNITGITMKAINLRFEGSNGSPYALINVQSKNDVGDITIYLKDIDISMSSQWMTYFIVISAGHIVSLTLKDSNLDQYFQTGGNGIVFFNGASQVDDVLVENIDAPKLYNPWHTAHLVHFAGTAATVGTVTIRNCYLAGVKDVFHVSGSATGSTFNTVAIENVMLKTHFFTSTDYGNPRYIVGLSGSITADKILIDGIKAYNLSGIVSSGNEQHIGNLTITNIYAHNVTEKIISLGVDTNRFDFFEMYNVTIEIFKDGADIRGVARGLFRHINLTGGTEGNGLYFKNVNNTILEDLYFRDGGWKNIVFDSIHENITIRNFVDIENNMPNMLVAVGPWDTASVKNITIENGVVYSEDLLTVYDLSDYINGLTIKNVTVHGASPVGWENGRCGTSIYLRHADNVYITNFTSENPKIYGIYLDTVNNAEIVYSNFSHTADYGIYITNNATNIYVHNSTFWYDGKRPQAYSDSGSVMAQYNLYTDHISTDNNGDGIADTPYSWAGSGGVVDLSPIYYPVGIAYIIINDTTLADNTYGVVAGGSGTAGDPYIVVLNAPNVPSTFLYGVLIDNVSVYVKVSGTIGGSMTEAAVYVGSNITGNVNMSGLTVSSSGKHGIHVKELDGHLELHSITITSVGGQALFFDHVSNIIAESITIDMSGSGWDGLHLESSNHISVSDITITNPGYKGVYIETSSYITVEHATINGGNNDYSIYLTGSFIDHVILDHVSVTGGTRSLYADAASITYLYLYNFEADNPGWDGIFIKGSDLQDSWFENITISHVEYKTFYLKGRGSNITIKNYVFDGSGGTYAQHGALSIDGDAPHYYSDIVIDGVSISNASPGDWGDWGPGAIYIVKTDNVVIKNANIHDTAGDAGIAIFVRECNNVAIENSVVRDNAVKASSTAGAVTVMYTDGFTMINTVILGSTNGGRGLVLVGVSNIVLDHITIKDNAYHGIVAYGPVNMVLKLSTISGNGGKGLGIYWSGALARYPENIQILNNTFTNNGLNAIYIQSGYQEGNVGGPSHILIKYNTFERNGYSATTVMGGYAIWIGANCTDVNVTWNDFIWNKNNYIANHHSQAYSDSTLFDYNFWNDAGGAGYTESYPIEGAAGDVDQHPRNSGLHGEVMPMPEAPILPILLLAALLFIIVVKKRK